VFTSAPDIRLISAPAEQVVAIIESINTPRVALGQGPPERTQAYIIGVRQPDNTFTVYLYWDLLQSGVGVFYTTEPRTIPLAQYPVVEAAAIEHVESLGFMVDNLKFRRLPQAEQHALLERIPAFHERASESRPPTLNSLQGLAQLDSEILGLAEPSLSHEAELSELESLVEDDEEADEADNLPVVRAEHSDAVQDRADLLADLEPEGARVGATSRLSAESRHNLVRLLSAF